MIYELRIYTCRPGTSSQVIRMWREEGQAMLEPYFQMVGQWIGETGIGDRIYTLWSYRDMNHRQEARAALLQHPGFAEYLERCRALYVQQEAILMSPTPISPIK